MGFGFTDIDGDGHSTLQLTHNSELSLPCRQVCRHPVRANPVDAGTPAGGRAIIAPGAAQGSAIIAGAAHDSAALLACRAPGPPAGLSQPATQVPVEIEIFGFLEAEAAEMAAAVKAAAEKAAVIMRD